MANASFINGGRFFSSSSAAPVSICARFTVAAADTAGYGVTNVSGGGGIAAVYMHTSQTPAGAINPATGVIAIKLTDNYNSVLAVLPSIYSGVTGNSISISGSTVMTVGRAYQILTVGTSTQANWEAAGLQAGITAAVGVTFIAKITGSGTGTGTVKLIGNSGIVSVEVCGDPNYTVAPWTVAGIKGAYIYLQCLGATAADNTALIPAAPVDGSIINLHLILNNSSVSAGTAGQ